MLQALALCNIKLTKDRKSMKVFISADIEGVAGVSHWEEASSKGPGYQEARHLMTQEVVAACKGAFEAGAEEIFIKDAHGNGRNIITSLLPEKVKIIRGWSGHPFVMMQELDDTFNAVLMIGYHSHTVSEANPLAHTFIIQIAHIKINGEFASEFLFNAFTASLVNVPVAFVSGDIATCEETKILNKNIKTEAVTQGKGASTISLSPKQSCRKIKEGTVKALQSDFTACSFDLPDYFEVEIKFTDPISAYRASFYPGMKKGDSQTVIFETDSYFDVLRMLIFIR